MVVGYLHSWTFAYSHFAISIVGELATSVKARMVNLKVPDVLIPVWLLKQVRFKNSL